MAIDKKGIPFHPEEYNPDYPRIKCKQCGLMNSCEHDLVDAEPWYPRLPILLDGGMVQSIDDFVLHKWTCLLYTSPSPRDRQKSRMPSSA